MFASFFCYCCSFKWHYSVPIRQTSRRHRNDESVARAYRNVIMWLSHKLNTLWHCWWWLIVVTGTTIVACRRRRQRQLQFNSWRDTIRICFDWLFFFSCRSAIILFMWYHRKWNYYRMGIPAPRCTTHIGGDFNGLASYIIISIPPFAWFRNNIHFNFKWIYFIEWDTHVFFFFLLLIDVTYLHNTQHSPPTDDSPLAFEFLIEMISMRPELKKYFNQHSAVIYLVQCFTWIIE